MLARSLFYVYLLMLNFGLGLRTSTFRVIGEFETWGRML